MKVKAQRSAGHAAELPPNTESFGNAVGAVRVFKRLDVRKLIRKGVAPLDMIHRALREGSPDEGVILMTSLSPRPLLRRLAREGFYHRSECSPMGDWFVWLWRGHKN